jgi:hypothetical protein
MSMIDVAATERRVAERIDQSIAGGLAFSRGAGGIAFTNAGEAMEFAKMMAVSQIGVRKHLRGNVGACLAITVQSIEWGMSPFAVANKSYLVNDQIAYESQLVQAVILKRAPIKGRFKVEYIGAGGKRQCKVSATLLDGEVVDYTSPEFDKITPKNSPLWKSDPDQQQFYYSGRALCRRHFPDVLLGVYDVDELPEAPRDPSGARNITPVTRTLESRLDALADVVDAGHDQAVGEVIAEQAGEDGAEADPEGEVELATEATDAPVADLFAGRSMAFRFGFDAFGQGVPRDKAPGDLGPDEVEEWEAGWSAGEAQSKASGAKRKK